MRFNILQPLHSPCSQTEICCTERCMISSPLIDMAVFASVCFNADHNGTCTYSKLSRHGHHKVKFTLHTQTGLTGVLAKEVTANVYALHHSVLKVKMFNQWTVYIHWDVVQMYTSWPLHQVPCALVAGMQVVFLQAILSSWYAHTCTKLEFIFISMYYMHPCVSVHNWQSSVFKKIVCLHKINTVQTIHFLLVWYTDKWGFNLCMHMQSSGHMVE